MDHKSRPILIFVVVATIFIVLLCNKENDTSTTSETTTDSYESQQRAEKSAFEKRQKDSIQRIRDINNLYSNLITYADYISDLRFDYPENESNFNFNNDILVFKIGWDYIDQANRLNIDSITQKTEPLKRALQKSQATNFPVMRKAYWRICKNAVWEYDVAVSISGQGNTTLSLTGHYFAANKNIKFIFGKMSDVCHLLRFKKVIFKWYKYDDEYTYYTLDSPSDKDPVK